MEKDYEDDPAYPIALSEAERALIEARQRWMQQRDRGNSSGATSREATPLELDSPGLANPADTLTDLKGRGRARVGMALSGGGIRSATFALGFFQALAKRDLLQHIDYLSTVSGGGYFGGFYGRMFHRRKEDGTKVDVDAASEKLKPDWSPSGAEDGERNTWTGTKPVKWLRENGRYLAPNGAGDTLVAASVLLRNWVAIWVALGSAILTLLLSVLYVRTWIEDAYVEMCMASPELVVCPSAVGHFDPMRWTLPGHAVLWASPLFAVPLVLLVLAVMPLAWAYWLTPASPGEPRVRVALRWVATMAWLVVAAWSSMLTFGGWAPSSRLVPEVSVAVATTVVIVGALGYGAMVWVPLAALIRWLSRRELLLGFFAVVAIGASLLHGPGLLAAAVGVLLAVLVSTWLIVRNDGQDALPRRISSVFAGSVACVAFFVTLAFIDSLGQTTYAVMMAPESTVFAWLVAIASGLGLSAGAVRKAATTFYRMVDKRAKPSVSIPAGIVALLVASFVLVSFSVASHGIAHGFRPPKHAPPVLSEAGVDDDGDRVEDYTPARADEEQIRASLRTLDPAEDSLFGGFWLMLVVTLLTGGSLSFINRSSHLPLYKARLVRAYLGASNPQRLSPEGEDVTRVYPDDDIAMGDYWPFAWDERNKAIGHHEETGAPLHIVNVTINETVLGPSKIQEQDRRGFGLAVGPCGFSAGIRHHMVRPLEGAGSSSGGSYDIHPPGSGADTYRVFGPDARPERLSLGHWLGISGAAFTTGLGFRTSLGLSMLLGLANVRLGHWWNSGVVRTRLSGVPRKLARLVGGAVFVVQRHLFDELTARFHGTAKQHWYLSDGGHFENTGVYELIRRRLPVVVVLDASADPDCRFEDLANLIRKARLDFNTTIQFRPGSSPRGTSTMATTLDDLKPRTPDKDQSADGLPTSNAHAALAKITYPDGSRGWLLYIKPTIVGDEPHDVLQYRAENLAFPHEPTVDQFFDEAQWESYRRLGQHIGEVLTDKGTAVVHPDLNETLRRLLEDAGRGGKAFFSPDPWLSERDGCGPSASI